LGKAAACPREYFIEYRDAIFAAIDLALKIVDDFLWDVAGFEGRHIGFKITNLLLKSISGLADLLLVRLDAVRVVEVGTVDVQSGELAPQDLPYQPTRIILCRRILDAPHQLEAGSRDRLGGAPLFDGRVRRAATAAPRPLGGFALFALLIQKAWVFACVPRDRRDGAAFALDVSLIGGVVEIASLAALHQQMTAASWLDEDGLPSRSGMQDLPLDPVR